MTPQMERLLQTIDSTSVDEIEAKAAEYAEMTGMPGSAYAWGCASARLFMIAAAARSVRESESASV